MRDPHWNPDAMYPDPEFDVMATPQEACREYARNVGAERPDSPWILTDYDSVEPNPFFRGPPCRKAFCEYYDEPDDGFLNLHTECWDSGGRKCLHGYGDPVYRPVYNAYYATKRDDDDLPF